MIFARKTLVEEFGHGIQLSRSDLLRVDRRRNNADPDLPWANDDARSDENGSKMLGTMMMPVGGMTYGIGLMSHAVMSILFASAHAAFYLWLDIDSSFAIGIVFGLVHFMGTGMFLECSVFPRPRDS